MGKDSGDDFRDGKVTLPVILAHIRGNADEQKFWRDAMLGNRISDADLQHARTLLQAHNAIDDTLDRARHYGQRAIDAIAHFPNGEAKSALTEAVEFAIARAY
jgi:octaprenyl-diphosphate synthase